MMISSTTSLQLKPLIDGRFVDAACEEVCSIYSPATGKRLASYSVGAAEDADRAVRSARAAFESGCWSEAPPSYRKAVLHRLADLIERDAHEIDRVDAVEMGKPISTTFCSATAGAG